MTSSIPPIRIGLGYDSHRLGNGGPLRIGGVDVPAEVHAIGHSDADVLLHSITDALLGTVCEADIGRLFPDDAEENRDRESQDFVREAARRLRRHSMQIVNLDCVIIAEQPKMAPHIDNIRSALSELLDISIDQISVKAKTAEGLGAIGDAAAIASHVVVLVARSA